MPPLLTFYGARLAPNPRRVAVFLAEHGLYEGAGYAYVDIDMYKGEHKRGGNLAICRYVEESKVATGGAGVRLFGCGPLQRAKVEMWTRRVELELLFSSVGKAWYHGPTLAPMRKSSGLTAHDSELQLGMRTAQRFYKEVERELQAKGPFLAGEDFTVADITLLCVLDFGAGPVQVPMLWSKLPHLLAWHVRVSARESVRLHKDPYRPQGSPIYADRNVIGVQGSSKL
eukprot:gene2133-27934_t